MLRYEHWRDADIWLWHSADESSGLGLKACVLSDKLPGISEFSRILSISEVVIMVVDKGVNEAHHYDSVLEAS